MTLLLIRIAVWGNVAAVTILPTLALEFVNRTVENRLDHAIRHSPGTGAVAVWLQQRANGVGFTTSDPGIR